MVVSTEAAAVASLFRDLDGYPQPLRDRLETLLRDYTRLVIDKEWPATSKESRWKTATCCSIGLRTR